MKNFEVYIIVAVIIGIGLYWYNNRAATPTTSAANGPVQHITVSSIDTCSKNLFPCGKIVTCCGTVL